MAAVGSVCSKPEPVVGEMILVAADVGAEPDNDDFGQMLKRDAPCAGRITIYASDNDLALMASGPRAGIGELELLDHERTGELLEYRGANPHLSALGRPVFRGVSGVHA